MCMINLFAVFTNRFDLVICLHHVMLLLVDMVENQHVISDLAVIFPGNILPCPELITFRECPEH